MGTRSPSEVVAEVIREMDLIVFQLERKEHEDPATRELLRKRMRKELERLKEMLEDVSSAL